MRDINITKINTYLYFKDGRIINHTRTQDLERDIRLYLKSVKFDFVINAEFLQTDNETLGISFLGVDFLWNKNTKEFSKDQLECLFLNREQIGRPYCWQEQPGEQNI